MLAVQPRGGGGGDEELRSVCVWSRVGHGEDAGADVVELVQGEGFVGELAAVDGVPARAVGLLEVTTLDHEVGDDAVEDGVLVPEVPLARRELPEVLNRLRHILAKQPDDYPPLGLTADGNVEVHLVGDLGVAQEGRRVRGGARISEGGGNRGGRGGSSGAHQGDPAAGGGGLRLITSRRAPDNPLLGARHGRYGTDSLTLGLRHASADGEGREHRRQRHREQTG